MIMIIFYLSHYVFTTLRPYLTNDEGVVFFIMEKKGSDFSEPFVYHLKEAYPSSAITTLPLIALASSSDRR